jgi:hypothetical protein
MHNALDGRAEIACAPRQGLSCFAPVSPTLIPQARDLARECWRVNCLAIAERWHSLMFMPMLLPAPAGLVLVHLPEREPLHLIGDGARLRAQVLALFGIDYATLPRGALAGAFILCI